MNIILIHTILPKKLLPNSAIKENYKHIQWKNQALMTFSQHEELYILILPQNNRVTGYSQ